jgi:hypothetical protein
VRAWAWGCLLKTESSLDRILEIASTGEDRITIKEILSDVIPIRWNIKYHKVEAHPLEEMPDNVEVITDLPIVDTELMVPYDLDQLESGTNIDDSLLRDENGEMLKDGDLKFRIDKINGEIRGRIPQESKVGGIMKFRNFLLVTRLTMGAQRFRDNVYIRAMRYYSDTFKSEPFNETADMRPIDVTKDSMAPVRFHVLHEAAVIHHMKYSGMSKTSEWLKFKRRYAGDVSLSSAYREMVQFVFDDPWTNTLAIKKATGVVKQTTFITSKSGHALHWLDIDIESKLGRDRRHTLKESGFKLEGVELLGNDISSYESSKLDIESDLEKLNDLGLTKLSKWYRYMLSCEVNEDTVAQSSELSFIETVSGYLRGNVFRSHVSQVLKKPPLGPVPAPYHEHVVGEVGKIIDASYARIPSYDAFKANLFSTMTTKSSGYKVLYDIEFSGRRHKVGSTNKTDVFLTDPNRYLLPSTMRSELTVDNPGKVASREVPARALRAVFMIPLSSYVHEQSLGPTFLSYQSSQPEYTLAAEVGRSLADHAFGIKASASSTVLIKLQDYSQYDSSERFVTARQSVLDGLKVHLEKHGLTAAYGPYESLYKLLEEMWTRHASAVFVSGPYQMTLDQVLSGETFTITINNIINKANSNLIEELIKDNIVVGHDLEVLKTFFMGDDSVTFYQTPKMLTSEQIDVVKDISSDVSASNSMELNKAKTSVRYFFYEYLKKRAEYGWFIPRVYQIQMHASERTNQHLDFQEQLRGYSGLLAEAASRGYDHHYLILHFLFFQNLRRRVKRGFRHGGGFADAPTFISFTPGVLGGAGLSSDTLAALSKEAVLFATYDRVMHCVCNYNAYVMDYDRRAFTRELVSQVAPTLEPGRKFIKANLNNERSLSSLNSVEFLASRGIEIGMLAYTRSDERLIEASVKDNHIFAPIIQENKYNRTVLLDGRKKDILDFKISHPNIYISTDTDELAYLIQNSLRPGTGQVGVILSSVKGYGIMPDSELLLLINEFVTRNGEVPVVINSKERPHVVLSSADLSMTFNDITRRFKFMAELREAVRVLLPAGSNPIKGYMDETFPWLKAFIFRYGADLSMSENTPVCPVAGLSEDLKLLMTTYGASGKGDDFSFQVNRLLTRVTHDPYFPRDIRVETMFDYITKPAILESPDNIREALMAMGARQGDAESVARGIYSIADEFTLIRKTSSYSTTDQVIGHLDLSQANYARVVKFNGYSGMTDALKRVLMSLGMIASIIDTPYKDEKTLNPRREVLIHTDTMFLREAEKELSPDFIVEYEITSPQYHGDLIT